MLWKDFSSRIGHFSDSEQEEIERAFHMGEKAHSNQTRQSGEPYFTHPIAVAEILIDLHADKDTVIAALLHDTIEDTKLSLDEVRDAFGEIVARMIDGLTKLDENELKEKPTLDEKIETLRKMFTLMQEDVRIMVIKLVDRLHNMRTISFRSEEKQYVVAKETLDVYVKIADRLCMRELRDELEGICLSVIEPEAFAALETLQKKNLKNVRAKIPAVRKEMQSLPQPVECDIMEEPKSWEKLRIQHDMEEDGLSVSVMLNIAFVCASIDQCYLLLGAVHQLWPREALTFEDNINSPIINGYKGLHTTIILPDGTRIRCKIRTREMHEYARRGITMYCFDSDERGMSEYVPWTRRINPLTRDTEDRSDEFWSSLQSDVLSESIVVYGSNNQPALVPKGATALDAALHLYPRNALKLTTIYVNGEDVPLSHKLDNGAFVEIAVGNDTVLNRDWLYWVQTGMGIAVIRSALMKEMDSDLAALGKSILQKAVHERGKGYIEEMRDDRLRTAAAALGYKDLESAYRAIAGRHLEPSDFLLQLHHPGSRNKEPVSAVKELCTVRFSTTKDVASMRRLLTVYERYNVTLRDIRLRFSLGDTLRMKVNISLTPDEQEAYRQELIAAGAQDVTVLPQSKSEFLLMGVVVLAWALNPVWAKYLLNQGITPLSLVSIRAIFFGVFAIGLYGIWRAVVGNAYSPVKKGFLLAAKPAIATFVLALLTYLSVSQLPPSVHLTILRFNVLLLPLAHLRMNQQRSLRSFLPALLLFCSCIGLILMLPTEFPRKGILLATLSLAAYMYYSLTTEHILVSNKIGARHPQFMLYLGLLLGALGLAIIPSQMNNMTAWQPLLTQIGLYAFFCVFVPHTCFHLVLQKVRFRHITSFSLFEVPLAILFEAAVLGLLLQPLSYLVISGLLIIISLLLNRRSSF